MIKVDVISGFLGAGKTTLIKHIINAVSESNEKIVIIENEFGDTAIDGKMLDLYGLTVYEIANGCMCCSLKSDFISTLIRIEEQIKPDRIIIEPSGIFVLSEIFDIIKHPDIREKLHLNGVITVIDSENFLKQRHRFGYFFESQIAYASKLILSKIENVQVESVTSIFEALQEVNPNALIYAYEWSRMNQTDFIELLEGRNTQKVESTWLKEKRLTKAHHGHQHFMGIGLSPDKDFTELELNSKLSELVKSGYGDVVRAKGFVNSDDQILEFHYVNGDFNITQVIGKISPSVCFIGENLNKEALFSLFE